MADLTKYEEFVDNLSMLDDEETRFEYILDLAKIHKDDPFPDEWKTEANLMHGCMSRVWMVSEKRDGRYYFRGNSDAAIVNGLVAMMTASFSGLTAQELADLTLDHVRKLNLGALTTQRQVGMMAMLKHLQKLGAAGEAAAANGDGDRAMLHDFMPGGAPGEEFSASRGEPLPDDRSPASDAAVIEALQTVYDPEIPVNIYDLGLIYEVDIDDRGNVSVEMSLTAPGCPVAGQMPAWVADAVSNVPGTGVVEVKLVWDPPWTQDRMSEDAKMALGLF